MTSIMQRAARALPALLLIAPVVARGQGGNNRGGGNAEAHDEDGIGLLKADRPHKALEAGRGHCARLTRA